MFWFVMFCVYLQTTKCDSVFQIILTSMEFESKIAMRRVSISSHLSLSILLTSLYALGMTRRLWLGLTALWDVGLSKISLAHVVHQDFAIAVVVRIDLISYCTGVQCLVNPGVILQNRKDISTAKNGLPIKFWYRLLLLYYKNCCWYW